MTSPPSAASEPPDLTDFRTFCSKLVLEDGTPMEVHDFQATMLRDYFAGATETLILISKKNGKSSLLGALALFHLVFDSDQRIFIAAASRDQATILFEQAAGFVRRTPSLAKRLKVQPGYRRIKASADHGYLRVLASDVDTADGVIPTLAMADELHRWKSSDMYGVLRDGLLGNARMLTISTAGTLEDSPLGELRRSAYELGVERDGPAYRYVKSPDGTFVMHEWALDPGADVADMALVKEANPAPWHTERTLRRRFESPSTTDWQWQRFACGIWTEGEEPWIEPKAWDALKASYTIEPGDRVMVGVDLGVKHDRTAVVIVRMEDMAVKAHIMVPPRGRALPLAAVEAKLRELHDLYTVQEFVYDPWSFRRSAELLENENLPMLEFPMSNERMTLASANLYKLIQERALKHDGDPELRSHVLAGTVKETERGWRLVKDPKQSRPIDALIALAIAAKVATDQAYDGGLVEVF
jgi:phage terminase large subunit-like protein